MHGADVGIIGPATLLFVVVGPIALWLTGALAASRPLAASSRLSFDPRLLVSSALYCALAFNLTFLLQELFLVLPKAWTPGLDPTLFHNNHTWRGDEPIARLFQGTGALATFIAGLLFLGLLRIAPQGGARLFAWWMAYHGLMMALPQLPSGVFAPSSDVGQAMDYLELSSSAKQALALVALAAIAGFSLLLARPLFETAQSSTLIETPRARRRFVINAAILPALIAAALTIPFRWPTSPANLVLPQLLIAVFGLSWIYAGAWLFADAAALGKPARTPWAAGLALAALLAIFQLLLAQGVEF